MTPKENLERRDAIRREITKLVEEFATLKDDQEVFITAWGLAYEATSIEMEVEGEALRGIIVPEHQSVSASVGLGLFPTQSYDPHWG